MTIPAQLRYWLARCGLLRSDRQAATHAMIYELQRARGALEHARKVAYALAMDRDVARLEAALGALIDQAWPINNGPR